MANEGFIKLYRKMRKWGWYDEPYTKVVFLHLLFLAQYEETFYRGVHLEPGQAVATLPEIALENGISVQNVRTAIEHLKSTGELTVKKHHKFTVYTVKNYDQYNGTNSPSNSLPTVNQQAANSLPTGNQQSFLILRNKEVEEVKNGVGDADASAPPKKTSRKTFEKPTVAELEAYAAELAYRLDAQRFWDYYEANGWMVGKTHMKDWKACVRNWKRRDEKPAAAKPGGRNAPVSRELPVNGPDFLKDGANRPRKLKRGS